MKQGLISSVLALVEAAGQATLAYWQADVAVQTKADESPVTAADLAAHQILAQGLAELDSRIPVLSEEDCEIALSERAQWTRWWLVDPLDGTKEFIHGSAEYTVNVALIEQGRVIFGVVGVPVTGQLYYGGLDLGAYCRDADGSVRRLQMRSTPVDELVVVASKRHSSPEQEALLQDLSQAFTGLHLLNVGSSLKFCQLAEGSADLYPRFAPTSQWDTAAAQGVLEGAGGTVINMQGEPLSYAAGADYLNPYFLAFAQDSNWQQWFMARL